MISCRKDTGSVTAQKNFKVIVSEQKSQNEEKHEMLVLSPSLLEGRGSKVEGSGRRFLPRGSSVSLREMEFRHCTDFQGGRGHPVSLFYITGNNNNNNSNKYYCLGLELIY